MKRYWLFAGDWYYPSGGFNDFIECSDDYQVLHEKAIKYKDDDINIEWCHIYDIQEMKCVYHSKNGWGVL